MHAAQRTTRRGRRKEAVPYFAKVTKLLVEEKTEMTRKDLKDKRGNKKTSQLTRKPINDRSSTAPSNQKLLSLSYTHLKSL